VKKTTGAVAKLCYGASLRTQTHRSATRGEYQQYGAWRLQGDSHIFIARAYVSFEFLGYSSYFLPDLLLIRIPNVNDNDPRQVALELAKSR
jgi:hypothetical protein